MPNLRLAGLTLASAIWLGAIGPAHAIEPGAMPAWTWELGVEGVYAARGKAPGAPIGQDVGLLNPFVSGDSFDFNRRFGGNIWLRARRGAFAVEARYFGGFHFNSSANGTAPLDWFISGNPSVVLGNGATLLPFGASYESRLHSVEGNLRWYVLPQLAVFGGVRWLELKESLGLVSDVTVFQLDTNSRGVGPQIGLDWRAIAPADAHGFFLDFDGRVGWLFAQQQASFQLNSFPVTGSGSSDQGMPVAELGATVGLQMTPNTEVRLGYRALHLGGVALAPVQVEHTSFTAGTVDIVHDAIWIHGATLGFVLRY
jgi:hypothetical protein